MQEEEAPEAAMWEEEAPEAATQEEEGPEAPTQEEEATDAPTQEEEGPEAPTQEAEGEAVKSGLGKPEPSKPEPSKPEPSKPKPSKPKPTKPKPKAPTYDATAFDKAPQLKKIKKSIIQALKITKAALVHVKKASSHYKKWMDKKARSGSADGAVDTRIQHVKKGFEKVKKCLEEDKVIFKKWDLPTADKADTFAYVRKAEKDDNIYLGGAFWVAKTKGIDSSAGPSVRALGYRLPDPSEHACRTGEATGFADNDPADATRRTPTAMRTWPRGRKVSSCGTCSSPWRSAPLRPRTAP